MILRVGRRVPENAYLQFGPEPSDADGVLFSIRRSPELVAWMVAAVAFADATLAGADGFDDASPERAGALLDAAEAAAHAYRAAREQVTE